MGLFDSFFKKSDNKDRFYHAIAKVSVSMICNTEDSRSSLAPLNLSQDDFEAIHVEKRFLGVMTFLVTSQILLDQKKSNKLVKIFLYYFQIQDGYEIMPHELKILYKETMDIRIEEYLKVEKIVQNRESNNRISLLCRGFGELFAAFCNQQNNMIYVEIGKDSFNLFHSVIRKGIEDHLL